MRRALLLIVVLTAACEAAPVRAVPTNNPGVTVVVIAEFDGVTLYRVTDGSDRTVYVAKSAGALRAEWVEQQGKTSVKRETETVER